MQVVQLLCVFGAGHALQSLNYPYPPALAQVEIKAKEDEIRALRVSGLCGRKHAVQSWPPVPAVLATHAAHGTSDVPPLALGCPAAFTCRQSPQEEGAKAAKAREAMAAKLQQLEKQKGEVERTRDELKVGCSRTEGLNPGMMGRWL